MAKNECLKSRLSSVSKKLKRKGFCQSVLLMLRFLFMLSPTFFLLDTSIVFPMIMSVIMLYMLIILFSTQYMIELLNCGNCLGWFLNLNLAFETLKIGVKGSLLILIPEQLNLFHFILHVPLMLLLFKWINSPLMLNHLLRCWNFLS